MKRTLLAMALALMPLSAMAQPVQYQAADAINNVPVSAATPLPTTGTVTGTPNVNNAQYGGNATATGNGVTTTGTQRVTISSDSTGQVAGAGIASGADGVSNTTTGLQDYSRLSLFNGTTWDRGFTCNQSANISVTAGATTQIIPLSGATVIRVCSISLTMGAAGTFGLYYGTGTNCATGLATLTVMSLATGIPFTYASGNGSVFRSAAGNAFCVSAATGNVNGIVTYAQY